MTDQVKQAIINGTAGHNLSVGGSLYLRGTAITAIPTSAKISGNIIR